jgi:hypothetical protein
VTQWVAALPTAGRTRLNGEEFRVIKEMGVDPDKLPRLRFECQPLGANKVR